MLVTQAHALGGNRSMLLDACMVPLAWLLALVCICGVSVHDMQEQQQQPQQAWSSPFQQLLSLPLHKSSSTTWAAIAAHPGDVGLLATVLLPHILLLLVVASLLGRRQEPAPPAALMARVASAKSSLAALLFDAGSTGAAVFFAVAKLLPLSCSLLVTLAGCCGLRSSHPCSQALQLLHPLTPVLTAAMTLLSQAPFAHTLAVTVSHSIMAGTVLAAAHRKGASLPGYLTPAQAWLALLLLDVVLPSAFACWQRLPSQRHNAASPSHSNQPAVIDEAAAVKTPHQHASANSTHSRHIAAKAAEPASPAAALAPGAQETGHSHPVSHGSESPTAPSQHTPTVAKQQQDAGSNTIPMQQPPSSPRPTGGDTGTQHSPLLAAAGAAAGAASPLDHTSWSAPDPPATPPEPALTAPTPVMDFEQALAACARGVAARRSSGLSPATALYRSQLRHHVVSIKAPLDAAPESQELVQLVLDQLSSIQAGAGSQTTHPTGPTAITAAASSTTNAAAAPNVGHTSPQLHGPGPAAVVSPLMLRPVAMRGCLHMVLPLAVEPGGPAGTAAAAVSDAAGRPGSSCALDMLTDLLNTGQLPGAQRMSSNSSMQGPAASPVQLSLQIDQSEPQLLTARPDSSWSVQLHRSASSCSASTIDSCTAPTPAGSTSNSSGRTCWLQPPCVLLPGVGNSSMTGIPSPVAASLCKSSCRPSVTVLGVPAAAGSLVRVLLVQGPTLLADHLLPVASPKHAGGHEADLTHSVSLTLPEMGLHAGPAMVCVLAPPSSVAAASTAPAGVSPAVAALMTSPGSAGKQGSNSASCTEHLRSARMWACLPLLVVDDPQAEEQLNELFADMTGELQHQQHQQRRPQPTTFSEPSPISRSGHMHASATPAVASSLSVPSSSAQLVHTQHWQPLLWDWLYAAQGTAASCIPACITGVAQQFKASEHSGAAVSGGLYEQATVWGTDMLATSSSCNSAALYSRRAVAGYLLQLLVGRDLWAAVKQLRAVVAASTADVVTTAGQQPGEGNGSPAALSPQPASRHDSCDSYNQLVMAAGTPAGWQPPVHCKDAAAPTISLRQQQLQQQQQKYIQTLEATQQCRPPLHPQGQWQQQQQWGPANQDEGGEGRQPAHGRASVAATTTGAAVSSAGLSDAHRRLSLDTLPLPYAPTAAVAELQPPRWSLDMTSLQLQQQQHLFPPPSALFGAPSTTSPTAAGFMGAPGHGLLRRPAVPPLMMPSPGAAGAAAAAAGAAAAQVALMQLDKLSAGSFSNSPGSSLQPSPAMQQSRPGSSANRLMQAPSPLATSLSHLHPQASLGYSPSLASTASGGTFTTAGTAGSNGMGAVGGYGLAAAHGSSTAPQQPVSLQPSNVEGRTWAVFDTAGLEVYDAGMDTTAGTNLASTMAGIRSSTANSVTWLAVPTSQAGSGLPPTALRTPRTSRHSAGMYSSSTGKLRCSEQHHAASSSSLTPQPPRSQPLSRYMAGSAGLLGGTSSSGTLSMLPHAGRRQGPRTSLFSPASGATPVSTAGSQQQFDAAAYSPPDGLTAGHHHSGVGGFSTPKRPGPAQFVGASPLRGALWSPGAPQLNTLPTIGSEDSWDQNAQYLESPAQQPDVGMSTPVAQHHHQGLVTVQALPRMGQAGAAGWCATPRSAPRPQLLAGGPAATPRATGVHGSQHGAMTPAYYSSRTGNLVSMVGGGGDGGRDEGDTVSGVLHLLGTGAEGSMLTQGNSAALSGFSSSSSLAGTPEGMAGIMGHGSHQGGYFTPVRPNRTAAGGATAGAAAAALLPASARPAARAAAWATPAGVSGRNLPGMSGSFNTVGVNGPAGAAAGARAAQQQQVPDTPLLKAGRSIAGVLFSPAPLVPLGLQQQQQPRMSTPSHIQSLLPPPGSASRMKQAAALLDSAAVLGGSGAAAAHQSTPGAHHQQSSAAAAAALLQVSPPAAGSRPPSTPQAPDAHMAGASAMSSTSSIFNTQPHLTHLTSLSGGSAADADGVDDADADEVTTPCATPRACSPAGSPSGGGAAGASGPVGELGSGALHSGSKPPSCPPPAPVRPMPGVVLIPAVEAESLYGSDDYVCEGCEGGYEGVYEEEGMY